MTDEQKLLAAQHLLAAAFAAFPQLQLFPEATVQVLGGLWCADHEQGYSDREFFLRYEEEAGLISIAGSTMQAIEDTLACNRRCPECGEPMSRH